VAEAQATGLTIKNPNFNKWNKFAGGARKDWLLPVHGPITGRGRMRNDLKPTAAASQLNPHQPMSGRLRTVSSSSSDSSSSGRPGSSGRAKQPTFHQLSVLFFNESTSQREARQVKIQSVVRISLLIPGGL
jgi:hypothetical protein